MTVPPRHDDRVNHGELTQGASECLELLPRDLARVVWAGSRCSSGTRSMVGKGSSRSAGGEMGNEALIERTMGLEILGLQSICPSPRACTSTVPYDDRTTRKQREC
jgi:hypothetical protein